MNLRRHLTYANVMATIAMFGVLGGGAYAIRTKAPEDSVNSRAIVDNSVKSKDVKDNSLTGADIDQAALGGGAGGPPSGPAGGDLTGNYPKPQIAPGAVGKNALADGAVTARKLGEITVVQEDGVPDPGFGLSAHCPAGSRLVGGGAVIDGLDGELTGSVGNYSSGYWVAFSSNGARTTVYADCLTG